MHTWWVIGGKGGRKERGREQGGLELLLAALSTPAEVGDGNGDGDGDGDGEGDVGGEGDGGGDGEVDGTGERDVDGIV
ncbi:unnamed protein product [Closterium sp. NIES-54]